VAVTSPSTLRDPSALRNIALVGHHGAGKTTLVEAVLACAGVVPRAGSVEKGTTVCDFEPEEISRTLSVSLSVAPCPVGGVVLNLVDAPGYGDFSAEMATALEVADLAVVVVSATDGVQAQTEDAWRLAGEAGIPRVVVVSKLDLERADFHGTLEALHAVFGEGVAPVELPLGVGNDFTGVVDLLDSTARLYHPGDGPSAGVVAAVPAALADEVARVHQQLVEGIVVGDDDLMERYLDGDVPDPAELEAALATGIAAGTVFPVLCCSPTTGVGIDRLATLLAELSPSPLQGRPVVVDAGEGSQEVRCDPAGPVLLRVCRTMSDTHSGRTSICKVLSGTVETDTVVTNPRTRTDERLHVLESVCGRRTTPVQAVAAGDFVAIPRLTATATGDTLAPKGTPVRVQVRSLDPPVLPVAVRPASRADDQKLMTALHRLCEEDPSLSVRRVDETHQTVLGVTGEVHLAVVLERLQRKFGVSVEREDLVIPYRETVTGRAEAEGRHKKQTGGHGQFAVVHLVVEARPRGSGVEFTDAVVGGAIPRQFIPAVEKGVMETVAQGGALGYPVVDIAVTCDDGRHHAVDSSEMAFRAATALALRTALADAGPVLLEPVSRVEVTVPADLQGDVLSDLHARRARIQGTDTTPDGRQVIVALVPEAEMVQYAVDLRGITGGRGGYRSTHDHYDTVH